MPLTLLTPQQNISAEIALKIKRTEDAIIYQLAYIGESVVNLAKDTRGYTDRTGNLVSSTGYILVKDGRIIGSPYFQSEAGGTQGVSEGENYAAELAAKKIPKGIGIIVVAGMSYAEHVEATGRNVLQLSEIEAKKMVTQMFNRLGLKKI